MGFHTFDPARADQLEDPTRYASLSVDDLLALFDPATDDVAAAVGTVYAVDVQPEMHERTGRRGSRTTWCP